MLQYPAGVLLLFPARLLQFSLCPHLNHTCSNPPNKFNARAMSAVLQKLPLSFIKCYQSIYNFLLPATGNRNVLVAVAAVTIAPTPYILYKSSIA
jgi:hypothetical protein